MSDFTLIYIFVVALVIVVFLWKKSSSESYPQTMSHGKEVVMTTREQWNAFLQENKGRLAIVDFNATWCGPCRMMAPKFAEMSEQNPDVAFGSVDVDAMDQGVISECGISAMPTFQFFRNGEKVDELVGANPPKLAAMLQKYK